jgi:hypothetical protein
MNTACLGRRVLFGGLSQIRVTFYLGKYGSSFNLVEEMLLNTLGPRLQRKETHLKTTMKT